LSKRFVGIGTLSGSPDPEESERIRKCCLRTYVKNTPGKYIFIRPSFLEVFGIQHFVSGWNAAGIEPNASPSTQNFAFTNASSRKFMSTPIQVAMRSEGMLHTPARVQHVSWEAMDA
jgi:hypothetical protein